MVCCAILRAVVDDEAPPEAEEEEEHPLGEFIRRQRELSELSMRQFADMVGISNPYLSQIERGLRAPSERVLDSIAAAPRVSADSLHEEAGAQHGEAPETP